MEDGHVDAVVDENKKTDSIFALFSDLTGEKNQNPKHCLKLLKSLHGNEFRVGSGTNLEYSLKRLVRGLGSTRLHSQCGCFAVLTSVLKYRACSVEDVLRALEKDQKPAVQGATKSEVRAFNVESVLTCGAIIHSGQFGSQSAEIQENILKQLIEAGTKKTYLLPVACQFLYDVIGAVDAHQFKSVIWPVYKSEMFQNINECGPETFYVLLASLKKNPTVVNKFLQKNSISSDLLIENIVKCIFNGSVKCNHVIFDELGQYFCTSATSPVKIWSKCVNENAKLNPYKDTILIMLFSCIIKNLQEATIIPKLLVPKFLETVIKVLSFKKGKTPKDDCTNTARSALNSMVTLLCAESTSDETRYQSIKKLLFYPGNLKFEMKTGTKCMHSLVSQLSCESTKKLVDIYRQIVSGEVKKKVDENGTEDVWNNKEKQQALHIFTKTLNHPSLKKEIDWKLNEIKFIFEIGFLKKFDLPFDVQKCAKDCFYKAITVQMPSLKDLIVFLDELLLYVNESIKNKQLNTLEEVESVWDRMYTAVETLKKKSKGQTYTAVHVLLIFMGFYLLTDSELAESGIEELLSCYQHLKETQKKKNSQDSETPHWTEVTVDLILSLLSRENRLWRHVVSCVFPQVVSQITPTALQQIIDALDPKSQNNVLRHADSDESEDDSGDESESSGVSDGEEESDLEEDEGKPNDQLRLAVRNALGYSAAQTDDESIDMDQMGEDEERRLNESLSEAFRLFRSKSNSKKKKQTKEEEALTHFRLRVLDLIEIYVNNSPSMAGCLDLLPSLLDLLELSIKDHHQRPLQTRVDSVIKHISAVKTYSDVSSVQQDILKDVFQSVIARKETSALVFVEMSPRIADCTTFLVRCSQLLPSDNDNIPLVDEYDSLVKAFFQSRESRLPIAMFQSVLRMSWKGNFQIVATLFQLLASSLRIFKKMKIIELLRIFYKNDKLHSSCDKSTKSKLCEIESNFIEQFVAALSAYENNNSVKSTEKMHLSFFSNTIALINLIQTSSRKHRTDSKKSPPWSNLISKMAEMELIVTNKKTKSQLSSLANLLKVQLPSNEEITRKRKPSESRNEKEEDDEKGETEQETEEKEEKKKKKKMSAEKRKLKKESRKLREEISSSGLEMIRFSQVDSNFLPEEEETEEGENKKDESETEEEEKEPPKKKKKRKERGMNGLNSNWYANEVGESFRALISKHWVTASYGVASVYVLADTADKTIKADKKEKDKGNYRLTKVVEAAADTLLWQALASVIIPGFIINRICALSLFSLTKFTKLPTTTKKWTTTAVGLGSIPLIVKPIDTSVDFVLDRVLRPFFAD